jgi:PAS domain S-box-containing protein
MPSDLFDLNLYHWSVLPLYVLPALVNMGLFIYAQVFLPQNRINSTFSLFIFLLALSQFSDGMMHMSRSLETALMWQRISFAPWVFTMPIGVLFALSFGNEHAVHRSRITAIIIAPATVLLLLIIAGMSRFQMIFKDGWGWIANPEAVAFNFVVYGFVTLGTIAILFLLWRNWTISGKETIDRPKFLMLALGITIPYAGGLISEVMLPLFFEIDDVPLVGPLLTIFSVFSFIAIRKYSMLDYSPHSQWNRILETLREGVLIADHNRKIMYANPALCKLLGYTNEEIYGWEADKLIFANSLRGKEEEHGDREFQMATKHGRLVWVLSNISACMNYNGKKIGTIWTVTDINDLKRKGLEVKRSEQRLSRAQEVAHVGHWDLDFRTGEAVWSAEACRIYGLQPDDKIHRYEDWVSFLHPDDRDEVLSKLKNAQQKQSDADFEHRILLRDGTVKYIRSISKMEFDESHAIIGVYGVCQDVTEIRMAHERIVMATNELETYIYKSSHDLHGPLSSILGIINVSRMEIFDPTAVRYFQMIEQQAKKLDTARQEFIRAMHIKDASAFDEEIHVNAVVEDILDGLRSRDGFSRLKINVSISPEEKVIGNQFLMRTILHNLIENSIKYQDYNREHSTLHIDLQRKETCADIIVEDNGVGIHPEMHDKIFNMCYRAADTSEGSGLGLYLVKKAVERLDAKMSLSSRPGQGTRFTLSFVQAN